MSERRALLIGMNYYSGGLEELPATVHDTSEMERVLETHFNSHPNFEVTVRNSEFGDEVTAQKLLSQFDQFISNSGGLDLLFYFSGHGSAERWGMQLFTSEQSGQGMGISFEMLMHRASQEDFTSLTCIVDACDSGSAAQVGRSGPLDISFLRRNVTILASSTGESHLDDDISDYTKVIVEGLDGDAVDSSGIVTPFGLHRSASEKMRGSDNGSPVIKSNCSEYVDLRSPTHR